jgi:hypothetical protein
MRKNSAARGATGRAAAHSTVSAASLRSASTWETSSSPRALSAARAGGGEGGGEVRGTRRRRPTPLAAERRVAFAAGCGGFMVAGRAHRSITAAIPRPGDQSLRTDVGYQKMLENEGSVSMRRDAGTGEVMEIRLGRANHPGRGNHPGRLGAGNHPVCADRCTCHLSDVERQISCMCHTGRLAVAAIENNASVSESIWMAVEKNASVSTARRKS